MNKFAIFLSCGVALLASYLISSAAIAMDKEDGGCCCCYPRKPVGNQKAASKNIWKTYGFKSKEAYTHVANLIEEMIRQHPHFYEDTKIISGNALFTGLKINGKMVDYSESSTKGKSWVSLICPLAKGQEEFLKCLLFSIVSKLYADPFKLDLIAICRTKQWIGEYIFDQDANDEDKGYIRIALNNHFYYNKTRSGNPLSLIQDIDSPQLEIGAIVETIVNKRREQLKGIAESFEKNGEKNSLIHS